MHILWESLFPIWYNLEKSVENKSYSELNLRNFCFLHFFLGLSCYKIRTSTLKCTWICSVSGLCNSKNKMPLTQFTVSFAHSKLPRPSAEGQWQINFNDFSHIHKVKGTRKDGNPQDGLL